MADNKKSNSQPRKFSGQNEDEFEIPKTLAAAIHALGASIAAGKLHQIPVSDSIPKPENSQEDLAKLVNRLQETFGPKGTGSYGASGNAGQTAPPPSPFTPTASIDAGAKQKPERQTRYHMAMDELEDEHWANKP